MPVGHHRGITASVLAVVVVLGAGYLDFFIMENGLPKTTDTANVVVMILTAWNGLAAAVVAYFFGNSANSDRKTELLSASTPPSVDTTVVTPGRTTTTTSPSREPVGNPRSRTPPLPLDSET